MTTHTLSPAEFWLVMACIFVFVAAVSLKS